MANNCMSQVQACRIRVAVLGVDGVPYPGASNLYVTDDFVSVAVTPVYVDGTEISERNACDVVCTDYRGADTLRRGDIVITPCGPDPYLQALLTGSAILTNGSDIGWIAPPVGAVPNNQVSIEVWAKRVDNGTQDPYKPWAHWVYPMVRNLRMGPWTHLNGVLSPTYSGQCYENPNWYDGPVADWAGESDRIAQWLPTAILPTVVCGFQAIVAS